MSKILKQFVAYDGKEFALEWYFNSNGKSETLNYFEDLPQDNQKKVIHLFYLLGDVGKIFNKEKFRYEGNHVYAIKSAPNRFLCFFFEGAKIIITNAFEKKADKMSPKEKTKALKAMQDYIKRCKEGNYYD
ncbi:type II toxin-antitoxin system RelE/ParE family toxin [Candidatus Babeliales bacterium]|nr:type II toxin-antitoxin system RelE/ParE family toxin [Candidatus Babeliales bacterium]